MKSFLQLRLQERRPEILSKADYLVRWNQDHNVWAPIDATLLVCDACQGMAVSSHRKCRTCSDTGYVSKKHALGAYRAYYAFCRMELASCVAVEQRFEKFLKIANADDLKLVSELLKAPKRFKKPKRLAKIESKVAVKANVRQNLSTKATKPNRKASAK